MTTTPGHLRNAADAGRPERLRTLKQVVQERPAIRSDGKEPTRWIRRLVYERRLPYRKVGGRVLVDLDDVDAYLEGDYVPSAS